MMLWEKSFVVLQRVGWLIVIWTMSALSLGVIATLIRVLMSAAGLTVGSTQ